MRSEQLERAKVRQWEGWPVRAQQSGSTALEVGDVGQLLGGLSGGAIGILPPSTCNLLISYKLDPSVRLLT